MIAHWDVPAGGARDRAAASTWDGLAGGKVQRTGRYAFRLVGRAGWRPAQRRRSTSRAIASRSSGRRSSGPASAAFGGGRGHQGQDTFAACGTPLVAAHGGVVKYAGYHGRAGNYLVIDDEGVGHRLRLHAPARRRRWSRPATACGPGSRSASSATPAPPARCHLHFEIWTAPGLVLRRARRSTRCRRCAPGASTRLGGPGARPRRRGPCPRVSAPAPSRGARGPSRSRRRAAAGRPDAGPPRAPGSRVP